MRGWEFWYPSLDGDHDVYLFFEGVIFNIQAALKYASETDAKGLAITKSELNG